MPLRVCGVKLLVMHTEFCPTVYPYTSLLLLYKAAYSAAYPLVDKVLPTALLFTLATSYFYPCYVFYQMSS